MISEINDNDNHNHLIVLIGNKVAGVYYGKAKIKKD